MTQFGGSRQLLSSGDRTSFVVDPRSLVQGWPRHRDRLVRPAPDERRDGDRRVHAAAIPPFEAAPTSGIAGRRRTVRRETGLSPALSQAARLDRCRGGCTGHASLRSRACGGGVLGWIMLATVRRRRRQLYVPPGACWRYQSIRGRDAARMVSCVFSRRRTPSGAWPTLPCWRNRRQSRSLPSAPCDRDSASAGLTIQASRLPIQLLSRVAADRHLIRCRARIPGRPSDPPRPRPMAVSPSWQ